MSSKGRLKRFSRTTDRILGKILDPLADSCGGAVNLAIIVMISVITVFCGLMVFWENGYGLAACMIIFIVMVLAAKILTLDKIRLRKPWWYK